MLNLWLLAALAASVRVTVRRELHASASGALDAFLQRTWLRGGAAALPLVQLDSGSERTLWPVALTECIERVERCASEAAAHYTVTESGPLFGGADIAHRGKVRFSRAPAGPAGRCELVWDVAFVPPPGHSVAFWQRFTEIAIGSAAGDLAAHIRERQPQLTLVVRAPLRAGAPRVWREWLRFVWHEGGGLGLGPLTLPRPLLLPRGTRVVLPPGLAEQVLASDERGLSYVYSILNGGFLALYPSSEHAGVVRFFAGAEEPEGACLMEWVVRLRPLPLGRALVTRVTETVVCALAVNFARELGAQAGAGAGAAQGAEARISCEWSERGRLSDDDADAADSLAEALLLVGR